MLAGNSNLLGPHGDVNRDGDRRGWQLHYGVRPNTEYSASDVYITNTTKGQGPNYVSGITISVAGSGYQPETPITLTGSGTGAIAVANTSIATAPSTYQPAYGAALGYDLATGLGTVNAYNLVESSVWTSVTQSSQTINPFTVRPMRLQLHLHGDGNLHFGPTRGHNVFRFVQRQRVRQRSGTVITMTMTGDGTARSRPTSRGTASTLRQRQ